LTNPAIGLHFSITFLTQHLGLSIFDPNVGLKKTAFLEYKDVVHPNIKLNLQAKIRLHFKVV